MKFFQKRGVAITFMVLAIVSATVIGILKKSADKPEEPITVNQTEYADYIRLVQDDAGILSAETEERIAGQNAALMETYGSCIAVVTTRDEAQSTAAMQNLAYDRGDTMDLGTMDMLLLLNVQSELWYLAPGDRMNGYFDSKLEKLCRGRLDDVFDGNADFAVTEWMKEVSEGWYPGALPQAAADGAFSQPVQTARTGLLQRLLSWVRRAGIFSIICAAVAAIIVLRIVGSILRALFGGLGRANRRSFTGTRSTVFHEPPPANHRSGGSRGSFGGGSHGGFGGSGSHGGFGGGSRGGFGK